ncbi:2-phosphosulfolactate phosphatase [Melghirimyces profundicolus]|uniref:Probable 2-phosphosulfolactate phosphatase n=1 Tax=Melghirimyces profundicolus TaxID=1242148 RepID=A0A2T6BCW9_9BACL|nr:2-phosphosulfolactate phosphatase [Melghirimyces profundicolus]PTX53911.1 2-phosphosulfolactate phosphatase [Melghirimyces profundicolus]
MIASAFAHVDDLHSGHLTNRTTVVIDAFRSSTCIVTAVTNGARFILPAETVPLARELAGKEFLLGGERFGKKPDGFDLGNSPRDYRRENVKDRKLIMTTTNGTRALLKAEKAPDILVGCFLNATACAKTVRDLHRDVVFLCAGTRGNYSLEDGVAAGCILDALLELDSSVECTDLAQMLVLSYRACREHLFEVLSSSQSGKRLMARGHRKDIEDCLRVDRSSIVPRWRRGRVCL